MVCLGYKLLGKEGCVLLRWHISGCLGGQLMQEVRTADQAQSTAKRVELRKRGRDVIWVFYHHEYNDVLVSTLRLRSFSCGVWKLALGPCLRLHCHGISPGLRLVACQSFSKTAENFSCVQKKHWLRLFSLFFTVLPEAFRGFHCRL